MINGIRHGLSFKENEFVPFVGGPWNNRIHIMRLPLMPYIRVAKHEKTSLIVLSSTKTRMVVAKLCIYFLKKDWCGYPYYHFDEGGEK